MCQTSLPESWFLRRLASCGGFSTAGSFYEHRKSRREADLVIKSMMVGKPEVQGSAPGDVRMNPSRITPYRSELNVKRLAGDESAVASAPPPTSGRAPGGSPAAGQPAGPSV